MRPIAISLILVLAFNLSRAQDPQRFKAEVVEVRSQNANASSSKPIVFTGSSSIRMWRDLQQRFPEYNVINSGFGGSQTSDMFYFAEELIVGYKPKQVFIYEGDNDLGELKTPEQVLLDAGKLLNYIRGRLSRKVQVAFITPKPSIRRWHLRGEYETYIRMLKDWAGRQKNVVCVDVWSPMLDANGELRKDLFLEDDLHMNAKGYDIWTSTIKPYLKSKYKR
jgi:lysophospholipase L1-like esterase